jgi:assimilatory nitrate reductase catalytic subunit
MTATTCPYCGVGCGVIAAVDGSIKADTQHPSNRGRLCSKGAALGATLDDKHRLRMPTVRGSEVGWDAALHLVADTFRKTIELHGPDSVAFYVSGQCLTEDYYVANKLMKGFIGSGNIDTNSRLCMASSVAGHIRAFGEDVVPGVYEDFEAADLIVLVGSNTAWCHPVLHQRLQAERTTRGTRVVVLDPRRTATAEAADLHIPLAPGSDVALFNGLLAYLAAVGAVNREWVARRTTGIAAALAAATTGGPMRCVEGRAVPTATEIQWQAPPASELQEALVSEAGGVDPSNLVAFAAAQCGVDPEVLQAFYDLFAETERVMTVWSQGVNQSDTGTDKVNAIINCHLATGRIGRPGMGPFSVTGQPNAMGGREVGGLANQLAAHMRFDDSADRLSLQQFWQSPTLAPRPGLKAIDLFDAVLDGRVKALWIVATNPAASLPRADRVRAALAACPFVVVSDCWETDTTDRAHVVLPAAAWGEKDGTVTNSERRISRQRAFRKAPGAAMPDWWQFAQVGQRMGWRDAFTWNNPAGIFREHAALSGHANAGARLFDISGMATLDDAGYASMQPFRWPFPAGAVSEGGRLFANGGFSNLDQRARFVPVTYQLPPERNALLLNTGRVRDQWHTMTRTGLAPALMTHTPEPMLSIHPTDAAAAGVAQGDLVRVTTADGQALLRADLRHTQRRAEVFAPMHWTDRFASTGPIGRIVSALCDPVSGQPSLKATPATVEPVVVHFHGLLLRRDDRAMPTSCHWIRVPLTEGQLYRLAGLEPLPSGAELRRFAAALLSTADDTDWLELYDRRRGILRIAVVVDGALEACLFLAQDSTGLPSEATISPMLGAPVPDSARATILSGRLYGATAAEGPRICACFGVTRDAIRHAVATHNLHTVAEIGALLRAGTNCGSCIPELEEILRHVRIPAE